MRSPGVYSSREGYQGREPIMSIRYKVTEFILSGIYSSSFFACPCVGSYILGRKCKKCAKIFCTHTFMQHISAPPMQLLIIWHDYVAIPYLVWPLKSMVYAG